jgi:hypothetical protein
MMLIQISKGNGGHPVVCTRVDMLIALKAVRGREWGADDQIKTSLSLSLNHGSPDYSPFLDVRLMEFLV